MDANNDILTFWTHKSCPSARHERIQGEWR